MPHAVAGVAGTTVLGRPGGRGARIVVALLGHVGARGPTEVLPQVLLLLDEEAARAVGQEEGCKGGSLLERKGDENWATRGIGSSSESK